MQKQTKKSYRLKVFWMYLLLTLVPLSFFIGVVQTQYISVLKKHSLDALSKSAETLVLTVDNMFAQVDKTVAALSIDNNLKDSYLPQKPQDVYDLKQTLTQHINCNPFFEEITLYTNKSEYLFSNSSSYTKERFMQLKGLDGLTLDAFEKMLSGKETVILYSEKPQPAIHIFRFLKSGYQLHKTLIFSISVQRLQPYLRNSLLSDPGYCAITTAQGHMVVSYVSPELEVPARVLASSAEGAHSLTEQGMQWHAVTQTSPASKLKYQVMVQGGTISAGTLQLMRNWFALVALVLCLGFAVAWLVSRFSFRPISRLEEQVSGVDPDGEWRDEIEHISVSIDHLNRLALSLSTHMEELNDHLTFRLFKGSIVNVDEANQLSTILGASVYAAAYQTCIVSFGQELTCTEAQNSVRSMLDPNLSCLVRPAGDAWACALFFSIHDQGCIDSFCERFLAVYPRGRIAFGGSFKNLLDIPLSYMQALTAYEEQDGAIVSCPPCTADIIRLEDVLRRERCAEAAELLKQQMETLCEKTLIQVRLLTFRIFQATRDWRPEERKKLEIPDVYLLIACDSREELRQKLQSVLDVLENRAEQNAGLTDEPPLIEQMKDYLYSHYQEATFSVQQMAFDFRMAPSTLSRYFKQNNEIGINDFINDLKMQTAKHLLMETNLSIYDIGLELGYYGQNSFIRRFKATYGITPGEFRAGLDPDAPAAADPDSGSPSE